MSTVRKSQGQCRRGLCSQERTPVQLAALGCGRNARRRRARTREPMAAVFAIALQPFLGVAVTAALANLEAVRRFVAGWNARETSGAVGG